MSSHCHPVVSHHSTGSSTFLPPPHRTGHRNHWFSPQTSLIHTSGQQLMVWLQGLRSAGANPALSTRASGSSWQGLWTSSEGQEQGVGSLSLPQPLATQNCASALRGKIKPTQMWRRERANVTHAIIQNVIPMVQGDFREELAIIQRNSVKNSSGYPTQKSCWKFGRICRDNWWKFLQGHTNGAGKSDLTDSVCSDSVSGICTHPFIVHGCEFSLVAFPNPFVY